MAKSHKFSNIPRRQGMWLVRRAQADCHFYRPEDAHCTHLGIRVAIFDVILLSLNHIIIIIGPISVAIFDVILGPKQLKV